VGWPSPKGTENPEFYLIIGISPIVLIADFRLSILFWRTKRARYFFGFINGQNGQNGQNGHNVFLVL
jgi:hypothetical protein